MQTEALNLTTPGNSTGKWLFAVDRGGTFTDIIGVDKQGKVHTAKLLSQSKLYRDPALEGIRRILRDSDSVETITPVNVASIRMGTTIATNALLERQGAPVALFITEGFKDLMEIGDQSRPDIFSLRIKKPEVLYSIVKGVHERINARGEVETPIDLDKTKKDLKEIRNQGFDAVAVVLLHSWKNSIHEVEVEKLATAFGFKQVSVSHKVLPLIKIVGRGLTTLVDAYLALIIQRYVDNVSSKVNGVPLEFMKSSGGLVTTGHLKAKDTILSGPAGGVIGYAALARLLNLKEVVGFDMGGTSTDVSRYDGEFSRIFETTTGGIHYLTDQLDVETVAAGGGSILWFDGQKFNVGPKSAGSDPGPACYGLNGPLTVTDANLMLGRIIPEYMPITFGSDHDRPLFAEITVKKFKELTHEINQSLGTEYSPFEVAEGFIRVANEIMGRAIKKISVARGYDIRHHTLICFGGAAPQHACAIARTLGIRKIIVHPLASILSAYGIAEADRIERIAIAKMIPFTKQTYDEIISDTNTLQESAIGKFEGLDRYVRIEIKLYLDLRPLGTDTYLTIPIGIDGHYTFRTIIDQFKQRHQHRFGFYPDGSQLELVNVRIEAIAPGQHLSEKPFGGRYGTRAKPKPVEHRPVYFEGIVHNSPLYLRSDLQPGTVIDGPGIVTDKYTTVIIDPGFQLTVNQYGHLVIKELSRPVTKVNRHRDPVMLEVFNHLFMSVAEQMGYTLANTAHSVNMKERLDFSCAIFDEGGNLVANAPHLPVHLGAMGESVKYIRKQNVGSMKPGDVFITNNPYHGGSHLPDVTAISPVFDSAEDLIFFVATRGHHADIGGITPGSMPPFGTKLEEEGVVIDNFLLVSQNHFFEKEIRELLLNVPYPVRNIEERLSDLRAQVAANNKGLRELNRLVDQYTRPVVLAYMKHIQTNAAEAMTEALGKLLKEKSSFRSQFEDFLDDGTRIAVSVLIERGNNPPASHRMIIDFSGTDSETESNLNAPVAVTKAAVIYVLRSLIERDIPLNSGCLVPVEIRIPEGSLLNPSPGAAVVGGNVETSQRIVDVLFGALGVTAASQGTMNNFLFGKKDGGGNQYYETIAGGSGAMAGHIGASAVQVHMTNTRITDPEVLEHRFPEVSVMQFKIRHGSGGKGKWKGGDGVERVIKFNHPMHISVLSERRNFPPYGLAGGEPGACGQNLLIKADGSRVNLGGKVDRIVQPGETIVIQTPGGGGFGHAG